MLSMDHLIRIVFEKQASDLHLCVDMPPVLRIDGEISVTDMEKLKAETCRSLILSVLTDDQREKLEQESELTLAFGIEKIGRVRMHVFKQRGTLAAALRSIPNQIPSFEELGLPQVVNDIVQLPKGLILVAGPTGSGKSTTLSGMVEWINQSKSVHIVSIEDPLEYIFSNQKAMVSQREVGTDVPNRVHALEEILRCDPDVVLINDMNDRETIEAGLTIAETGHLVFASMSSADSIQVLYRLIDVFPPHQQIRIRNQLAITLQAVLAQQLLPRGYSSGRALACEVMIPTSAVRNLIREEKEHQVYTLMQTGQEYGMQTMNQALFELYQKQLVTYNEIFSRTTDPRDLQQLVKGTS